jgi:aryl-phospho-beta-D-glucosidase BglC (GH1 family)
MTTKASTEDTLVLVASEDAWEGNAEFTVSVDGVQVGGVQTVTAINGLGQTQDFTIKGDFGAGPHTVAVTFLNDAYGGSASMDRNLYVDSLSLDGTSLGNLNANVSGTATETITAAAPPAATDTLTVNVSEDAWEGDAEFIVLVDGVEVGGTQTATALHDAGQSQNITLTGNFGAGPHKVAVEFINDAYGGSAATDRNLYVNSVTYDGTTTTLNTSLYSNGSTTPVTVSAAPTITTGAVVAPADTLTIELAEDAYQGNASFAVFVDGVEQVGGTMSVTASNAAGAEQAFTFYGNYGSGPQSVIITYVNALVGGTAATDRDLYLKSITYNGVKQSGDSEQLSGGENTFTVTPTPTAPTTPTEPTTPAATVTSTIDTLVLYVSEDYYEGNAQFSVTVDGKAVGGTMTATGLHNAGGTTPMTLTGDFGTGPHTVVVTFLNDANGGSYLLDRNLYVSAVDYNGVYTPVNASLYSTGSASTTVVGQAGATPVTPLAAMSPAGTLHYVGVNLSGLEFGGAKYPGVLNTDYVEPTHAEIDYYASQGTNIIRLPIDWERLQPVMNGPLNQAYLSLMDNVIDYAATKGITVDIDVHNYGSYYGNQIGTSAVPNSAFDNLWSQIATHYASQSNVIFGLMNEPQQSSATQWVATENTAIAAIRATGDNQEILVSGIDNSGGESWTTSDNASAMLGIVDPKMNFAYDIHQYLDPGGGGLSAAVVSPTAGVQDLTAVTEWAAATGNRLFLGEFGSGSDAASLTAMKNMLDYVSHNTNVWQGATEWGGGPWWGNYFFGTDPVNGVTQPQISLLKTYT